LRVVHSSLVNDPVRRAGVSQRTLTFGNIGRADQNVNIPDKKTVIDAIFLLDMQGGYADAALMGFGRFL
jgi:hypothetical protein